MEPKQKLPDEKIYGCETCPLRQKAESNPNCLLTRLWRWHTGWCPGWKEYQTHLKLIAGQ